jgi:outer membrane protein assembly factor BamE
MNRSPLARRLFAAAPFVVAIAMAGCITPYRMDVQQGNVVTQEMVNQLRPGMTKSQVRFVLGTPLVTDPFHPDRWDYFYSMLRGRGENPERRHLTVIFRNDRLVRIEGDIAAPALEREIADTGPGGGGTQAGRPSETPSGSSVPLAPSERAEFHATSSRPL